MPAPDHQSNLGQDDYVQALVDGESLCKELANAGEEEETAKAGLEKERLRFFLLPKHERLGVSICYMENGNVLWKFVSFVFLALFLNPTLAEGCGVCPYATTVAHGVWRLVARLCLLQKPIPFFFVSSVRLGLITLVVCFSVGGPPVGSHTRPTNKAESHVACTTTF